MRKSILPVRRLRVRVLLLAALLGAATLGPGGAATQVNWQFYIDSVSGPGCGGCCTTGYCCSVPASCIRVE